MEKQTMQYISDIRENPVVSNWITDKGETFHGVLVARENNSLLLKVTFEGSKAIKFKYIRQLSKHDRKLGYWLYPFPSEGHIYPDELREQYFLNINYIVYKNITEKDKSALDIGNELTVSFKSYLHGNMKSSTRKGMATIDTNVDGSEYLEIPVSTGKMIVSLPTLEHSSYKPPSVKISMNTINFSFKSNTPLDYSDIFMWWARLTDLMTFIHQERVPTLNLSYAGDSIINPALIDLSEPASYAFRELITVKVFMRLLKTSIKNYVENYKEIEPILTDLCLYYENYASGVPDQIQLARLFISLENAANSARREPSFKSSDEKEVRDRKEQYKNYIMTIDGSGLEVPAPLMDFIKNSKKHYVEMGEEPDAIRKIVDLAEFINDTLSIHTNLIFPTKARMIWIMRNIVAHGLRVENQKSRIEARRDFYSNSGLCRTDTEKLIRAYILKTLQVEDVDAIHFSTPLKAVVMGLRENEEV